MSQRTGSGYFQQLTGERRVPEGWRTRDGAGRRFGASGSEALDCEVYALAALLAKLPARNWKRWRPRSRQRHKPPFEKERTKREQAYPMSVRLSPPRVVASVRRGRGGCWT
jgi:phage terminase large subunit GpA-like protein